MRYAIVAIGVFAILMTVTVGCVVLWHRQEVDRRLNVFLAKVVTAEGAVVRATIHENGPLDDEDWQVLKKALQKENVYPIYYMSKGVVVSNLEIRFADGTSDGVNVLSSKTWECEGAYFKFKNDPDLYRTICDPELIADYGL